MRILITSGGTKIPIDSVRHIGNMSSGTFGSKIAFEALRAGHEVTFLMAKGSKSPLGLRFVGNEPIPAVLKKVASNLKDRLLYGGRLRLREYSDFNSYEEALWSEVNSVHRENAPYDVVVLAAAVSDYDVVNKVDGKIRSKNAMMIELKPLPKLISRFVPQQLIHSERRALLRPSVLVGFKLLVGSTENELCEASYKSITENGCDLVVANDLRDIKADDHKLLLVMPERATRRVLSSKSDPNFLARTVVNAFTDIARARGVKT